MGKGYTSMIANPCSEVLILFLVEGYSKRKEFAPWEQMLSENILFVSLWGKDILS